MSLVKTYLMRYSVTANGANYPISMLGSLVFKLGDRVPL
ncbi:Uncharacterised protein [Vibrio cholerae]|nr:Uncharacterised protein [Vibrio cholerae]